MTPITDRGVSDVSSPPTFAASSSAAAVRDYLADCAELAALLPAIGERTRAEFGDTAELSLELYRDPEADDQYLTLFVRQREYEPNVLERIAQISSAFADRLEQVPGHLLVTTDFRTPRSNHGI